MRILGKTWQVFFTTFALSATAIAGDITLAIIDLPSFVIVNIVMGTVLLMVLVIWLCEHWDD